MMRKVSRKRRKKIYTHQKVYLHPCLLMRVASSLKAKRTLSADTIRDDSDDSDDSEGSDQALDMAALRRARRENPGTISILGSLSAKEGKLEDDEAHANAEKAKQLFELPSTEKIITGKY